MSTRFRQVRLCLDQIRSAHRQRVNYVGEWPPEHTVEAEAETAIEDDATLLHDLFGVLFEEVAETIGRDLGLKRQLATRARAHVGAERPRFEVPKERGLKIAKAFYNASRSGDMATLRATLAADVTIHSDGGGTRPAAMAPIVRLEDVRNAAERLTRLFAERGSELILAGIIDGLPGFVTREAEGQLQTTALELDDGKVVNIYVVRNPDKLRHLEVAALH